MKWSCRRCTFDNLKDTLNCEMCLGIRAIWDGQVFITCSKYRISDFLNNQLEKAFLSSFVYDWEWLEPLLGRAKVVFALHSRELKGIHKFSENRIAVVPPLGPYGCMHVKLMLLWYPGMMRLVITSANLISIDWEDLENIVYFQDFPISTTNTCVNTSRFYKDLIKIMQHLKAPQALLQEVEKVDFSTAKGNLVFSVPGKYSNQDYGSARLMKIIQEITPEQGLKEDQQVYYQVFIYSLNLD